MDPDQVMLTPNQARVLGSLMEKQMTTPDYYPLTLNALVAACNQKSSRNPVMTLSPQQVMQTINELRHEGLIAANTLSRADRYEQFLSRKLHLSSKERAIICVMLLRGPHTVNEIKVNTNRMVEFGDHEEILATLYALMERDEALVMLIPKIHGQRENRFTHLLCDQSDFAMPSETIDRPAPPVRTDLSDNRINELEARVAKLEQELKILKDAKTSGFL